jgi:hypothetical protein
MKNARNKVPTKREVLNEQARLQAETLANNARLGQMLGEGLERVRGERGTPHEDPVDALYRVITERDELLNIIAVDRMRRERLVRGDSVTVKFIG